MGRVNCFNPEGHSGQPKLQAVVGSTERLDGKPRGLKILKCFARMKEYNKRQLFQILGIDQIFKNRIISRILTFFVLVGKSNDLPVVFLNTCSFHFKYRL